MPGFNRTGPLGIGPMTGGGRGLCNPRGVRSSNQSYGFGFRGSSPSWPYVGRGRGGLPRCSYYPSSRGNTLIQGMTCEQEISLLKSHAENIKKEVDMVESRIRDLETEK